MKKSKKNNLKKACALFVSAVPHYLGKLLNIFYLCFFAVMILIIVVLPRYGFYNEWKLPILALSIIFLLLSIYLKPKIIFPNHIRKILVRCLPVVIIIVGFIVHFSIAYSLAPDPLKVGWDAGLIYQSAASISKGGTLDNEAVYYYGIYPFNVLPVVILSTWFKLWAQFGVINTSTLTVLLNIIFMQGAVIFAYLTTKRLINKSYAILSLILAEIFIALSPLSRSYYTDTVGILFPIAIYYLYYRIKELLKSQPRKIHTILLCILLGALISLGIGIKKYTIVIVIALIIFDVLPSLHSWTLRKRQTNLIRPTVAIVGAIIITSIALTGGNLVSGIDNRINTNATVPGSHYVMLGLKKICPEAANDGFRDCRYGAWNQEDINFMSSYYPNMDRYSTAATHEAVNRIKGYGTVGYPKYFTGKAAWILGDGTFYAYGEGSEALAKPLHGYNKITDLFFISGRGYAYYHLIIQSIWVTMLFLLILPLIVTKGFIYNKKINVLMASLIGVVLMSSILEGRSRYIYTYVPLFIVMSIYGLHVIRETLAKSHFTWSGRVKQAWGDLRG